MLLCTRAQRIFHAHSRPPAHACIHSPLPPPAASGCARRVASLPHRAPPDAESTTVRAFVESGRLGKEIAATRLVAAHSWRPLPMRADPPSVESHWEQTDAVLRRKGLSHIADRVSHMLAAPEWSGVPEQRAMTDSPAPEPSSAPPRPAGRRPDSAHIKYTALNLKAADAARELALLADSFPLPLTAAAFGLQSPGAAVPPLHASMAATLQGALSACLAEMDARGADSDSGSGSGSSADASADGALADRSHSSATATATATATAALLDVRSVTTDLLRFRYQRLAAARASAVAASRLWASRRQQYHRRGTPGRFRMSIDLGSFHEGHDGGMHPQAVFAAACAREASERASLAELLRTVDRYSRALFEATAHESTPLHSGTCVCV
jgi:hypothetical protein